MNHLPHSEKLKAVDWVYPRQNYSKGMVHKDERFATEANWN